MPPTHYLQITTTCDDRLALERLAQLLITERLAACAQVSGPMRSTYCWDGKVESTEEWQLQAKTREELRSEVYELIAAIHPYQVPQLTSTRLEHVAESYAQWIDQSLKRIAGTNS